jgi:hypothetical protein
MGVLFWSAKMDTVLPLAVSIALTKKPVSASPRVFVIALT